MIMSKGRILVVAPDAMAVLMALADEAYEVTVAKTFGQANYEIARSIVSGQRFRLAILDFQIGDQSGVDFMLKLRAILGDINILLLASDQEKVATALGSTFMPEALILRRANPRQPTEFNSLQTKTLLKKVAEGVRLRRLCLDTPDVQLNGWRFAQNMRGISSARLLMSEFSDGPFGEVENMIFVLTSDGRQVSMAIKPDLTNRQSIVLEMPTAVGCPIRCVTCKVHSQLNRFGQVMPCRVLTTDEMEALVFIAMSQSQAFKNLFRNNASADSLTIFFIGSGDGLVFNLHNCMELVRRLIRKETPRISFMLSTVGSKSGLQEFILKYLSLPVRLSISLNYAFKEIRKKYMPGIKRLSPEELIALGGQVSDKTGEKVIISLPVFAGVNDRWADARELVRLFTDRWHQFEFVLLVGCPGSFPGRPDTTETDVDNFRLKLVRAGMPGELLSQRETFAAYSNAALAHTRPVLKARISKKR